MEGNASEAGQILRVMPPDRIDLASLRLKPVFSRLFLGFGLMGGSYFQLEVDIWRSGPRSESGFDTAL